MGVNFACGGTGVRTFFSHRLPTDMPPGRLVFSAEAIHNDRSLTMRPLTYATFVAELLARGVVELAPPAPATVGIFFVGKRDSTQRLIFDARHINGLFNTTPQLEYFLSLRTRYVLCICKEALAFLRSLHTEADVEMWKSEGGTAVMRCLGFVIMCVCVTIKLVLIVSMCFVYFFFPS